MKRNMVIAAAGSLLLCATSFAQAEKPRYEVGFRAGAGAYSYLEDHPYTRGVVGVEACAFCGGSYAIFASYSHFLAPGSPSGYKSAELLTTGLRIQRNRRISPFFDIGFAAGYSRYLAGNTPRSITTAGLGLGAGVALRTANGLYVRPQARLYLMSELYVGATAEVAVGWRF